MPPWTGQAARTGGVAPPRPAERWYSGWVRRSFGHGETFTLMSMQVPAPPRTGRVMRIGELSRRTGVPARMLRYYEEQELLHPGRPTEIIRGILPFLDDPNDIRLPAECLTAQTANLLRREADRLQQRIDCLTRNRDAIRDYLAAIQPGTPPAEP